MIHDTIQSNGWCLPSSMLKPVLCAMAGFSAFLVYLYLMQCTRALHDGSGASLFHRLSRTFWRRKPLIYTRQLERLEWPDRVRAKSEPVSLCTCRRYRESWQYYACKLMQTCATENSEALKLTFEWVAMVWLYCTPVTVLSKEVKHNNHLDLMPEMYTLVFILLRMKLF